MTEDTLDIERSVIASIVYCNNLMDSLADILSPGCFTNSSTGKIYNAIRSQYDKGEPFDLVSLIHVIQADSFSSDTYKDLIDIVTNPNNNDGSHTLYHSRILASLNTRRMLKLYCQQFMKECDDLRQELDVIVDRHYHNINQQIDGEPKDKEFVTMGEVVPEVIGLIDDNRVDPSLRIGFLTGFPFIDRQGGLAKGTISVLAGRPSHGKSALALQWAVNGARNNWKVAYFSLEMSKDQLTTRVLSMESNISGIDIRIKPLNDNERSTVINASEYLKQQGVLDRIVFQQRQSANIEQIRAAIRKLHRQGKVQAVFIDYLQQILPDRESNAKSTEESIIGNNMLILQHLAIELGLVIVVLSQLNRQSTISGDGVPRISETRGSGRIEEYADNCYVIYQPAVDGSGRGFGGRHSDIDPHNMALVITGKCRNGPAGAHNFIAFEPQFTRFTYMENPPRISETPLNTTQTATLSLFNPNNY